MEGKYFFLLLAFLAIGIGWIDSLLWQHANFNRQVGKAGGLLEPVDKVVADQMQPEWTRLDLLEKMEKATDTATCGDIALQLYRHLGEMGLSQQQPGILAKFIDRHGEVRDGKVLEAYKLLIERAVRDNRADEAQRLILRLQPLAEKPPADINMLQTATEWAKKAGLTQLWLALAEKYYTAADWPIEARMRFARLLAEAYEAQQESEKAVGVRQRLADYEKWKNLQRLDREIMAAFAKADYALAEKKCHDVIALAPESSHGWYNLACALARQGKRADAIAELRKAVERGFDDAVHMRLDEDLETLRNEEAFARLLQQARMLERQAPRETIAVGEGLHCLERAPDDGFAYTVVMPATEPQKPRKLVIWLPPGPLMKEFILPALPFLLQDGGAAMIMTRRQLRGLSLADADRLFSVTLPDAAKIPGINAERPVLFGYGFGGQAALWLWSMYPERVGGLILHAAYPVDLKKYTESGQGVPLALPNSSAIQQTPVYAIVAEGQSATQLWKMEEEKWRKAGVPLTLRILPPQKEEWRLPEEEIKAIGKWLASIWSSERLAP